MHELVNLQVARRAPEQAHTAIKGWPKAGGSKKVNKVSHRTLEMCLKISEFMNREKDSTNDK